MLDDDRSKETLLEQAVKVATDTKIRKEVDNFEFSKLYVGENNLDAYQSF